jgi:hypothetical protein
MLYVNTLEPNARDRQHASHDGPLNGILTLQIAKSEAVKPRRIAVGNGQERSGDSNGRRVIEGETTTATN